MLQIGWKLIEFLVQSQQFFVCETGSLQPLCHQEGIYLAAINHPSPSSKNHKLGMQIYGTVI